MRSVEFYKLLVKLVGDLNAVAQAQSTGKLTTVAAKDKVSVLFDAFIAALAE
ncbi:MAG: hypothetical protein ABFS18_02185 [Thermodesulfobacteriota bacterium]